MALSEDTEALMLAYVYGELSASDARDFERRLSASTPEAAELRAEVESLKASRELFGKDALFGVKSGVDLPPAHLVDAIMNAEKIARPAAIRDAALARVAPPVDKTFTAKLSRWLLGGGLAVGAAAALFVVVTQTANEPKMEAPALESAGADSAAIASPTPVVAEPNDGDARAKLNAQPAEESPPAGMFAEGKNEGGEMAGVADNAIAPSSTSTTSLGGLQDLAKEEDARAVTEKLANANKPMDAEPPPAEPVPEAAPDAFADGTRSRAARDSRVAQDPAMDRAGASRGRADATGDLRGYKQDEADADAKKRSLALAQDEAKTKAVESAKESSQAKAKDAKPEPRSGDAFSFDALVDKAPAKPAPKADKKAEEKAEKREAEKKADVTLRDSESERMAGKAGMRSSVGADKGSASAGPAPGNLGVVGGAGGGIATGAAASSSGSSYAPATTTPSTPAVSPPPPPAPMKSPAPAQKPPMTTRAPADEADDDIADAPKRVISREELQEQRKALKKKSAAATPQMKVDAERAKRLEQANIALASGHRELAAKRWMGALDQMSLAENLDPDRALGATPLVGQMRALVELKRPVDAAKVARKLGRWDIRAYDVVAGLLLGAQVAQTIGDERLEREMWTRLLDVPSEKAKARAALDRMEGAKALRRMQYDSDAAEAPAAAAPAAESKE